MTALRRSRPRSKSRSGQVLPAVILLAGVLALTACGGETSGGRESDPGPVDGPVEFTEVTTFANPRMRAEESPMAVPLVAVADVADWLEPLAAPDLFVAEVAAAVENTLGADEEVYGLLLGTGCERPGGYTLTRAAGEIVLQVAPVMSTVQCFAPMTYLAVVTLDETD